MTAGMVSLNTSGHILPFPNDEVASFAIAQIIGVALAFSKPSNALKKFEFPHF